MTGATTTSRHPSVRWLFQLDRQQQLAETHDFATWLPAFVLFRLNMLLVLAIASTITVIPLNLVMVPEDRPLVLVLTAGFLVVHVSLWLFVRSSRAAAVPAPMLMLAVMLALEAYGLVFALLEPAYVAGLLVQIVMFAMILPAYPAAHAVNIVVVVSAAILVMANSDLDPDWEIFTVFLLFWAGITAMVAVIFLQNLQRRLLDERAKSERLLRNVLPVAVIQELKLTGESKPRKFDDVTVLYTDFVGFTEASTRVPPDELIADLSDIYAAFDDIVEDHGAERIKTVGDAYLAVAGMGGALNHPTQLVDAALDMIRFLERHNASSSRVWQMRIGVHRGPLVGGIVGHQRYVYDIFGDTVNTASRLEAASDPMRVNVSSEVRSELGDAYNLESRGLMPVKGKGDLEMYFVDP